MPLNLPISQHLIDVKYRVLKSLLITTFVGMTVVAFVNLLNQRPLINFFMPLVSGFVMLGLYKLSARPKYRRPVKIGFMIFLVNLYLPIAWLTSPGSFSAMSFYGVLILFIGLILSDKNIDFTIPLIGLFEMFALLQYEPLHPEQYTLYVPMATRAWDLSINFAIVSVILLVISITLNRYFDDEHQKLFKISITDQLTKVYNRRYLFQRLEEVHHLASMTGSVFSLIMIDINHFKLINDTYGHQVGDEVLIKLGSILINSCRKMDVPSRFGGDEFILLLPDADYEQASMVVNRILEGFQPLCVQYAETGLSLGIGITENHNLDIDEMIQAVDDHLYKNKREHKHSEPK